MEPEIIQNPELVNRFNNTIEKLDSFIAAANLTKGKGKLGVDSNGRFYSSAFFTNSESKIMRFVAGKMENVYRTASKYTPTSIFYESSVVFNELEKLADEIVLEIQDAENELLDPDSQAARTFQILKEKIGEVHNLGLKLLLGYFETAQKPGNPKSQRYFLRCKTLHEKFDFEKLKQTNIALKELRERTWNLADINKGVVTTKEIQKAINNEINYINSHKEQLAVICQRNKPEWSHYLANLSKLEKYNKDAFRNLMNDLIDAVKDNLTEGFFENIQEERDYVAHLKENLTKETIKSLLRENTEDNIRTINLAIASGALDYNNLLFELADPALDKEMVQTLVRDLILFGVNLDIQDEQGNTLLHYAIQRLNPDLCTQLLAMDARIDIINNAEVSAIEFAFDLERSEDEIGKEIGKKINEELLNRLAAKRNDTIDMTFDPAKLRKNIGVRGKKSKQKKAVKVLEKLGGGFGAVASAAETHTQLSETKKNLEWIDIKINQKREKLERPNLSDAKFTRLSKEIGELEADRKRLQEAAGIENQRSVVGLVGESAGLVGEVLEGAHKIVPGAELVTGAIKVTGTVLGVIGENKKLKMIDEIIKSLEEDIEVFDNLKKSYEKLGMTFRAKLMEFKSVETQGKKKFLKHQRSVVKSQAASETVSTAATVVKTGVNFLAAFIPGAGYVITATKFVSYAPSGMKLLNWFRGIGTLKIEDFKPYNEEIAPKGMEKKIGKRLKIKKSKEVLKDTENLIANRSDVIWFTELLRKSNILKENEEMDPQRVWDYIARFLID